jgi:hypothetical protein
MPRWNHQVFKWKPPSLSTILSLPITIQTVNVEKNLKYSEEIAQRAISSHLTILFFHVLFDMNYLLSL